MYFIRKLKPPEWNIEHKLGILCFPVLLVSFLLGGIKLMFGFIALLEFFVMLIQLGMYFRTKNTGFLWLSQAFLLIALKRGYADESWVSFDKKGNVSVLITKKDYLMYKDAFSFDQLCASLGKQFIDFFELHKNGDGVRIIDRFNALRLKSIYRMNLL